MQKGYYDLTYIHLMYFSLPYVTTPECFFFILFPINSLIFTGYGPIPTHKPMNVFMWKTRQSNVCNMEQDKLDRAELSLDGEQKGLRDYLILALGQL